MAGSGSLKGKVVAVDKRTGRPAWEAPLGAQSLAAVPPLVTPEMVYVVEDGKTLKALDVTTGKPKWQASAATELPLTLAEDRLIARTAQAIIALNRWNGKRLWEFNPSMLYEWKLDPHVAPVAAPGRLLLSAGNTLIGLDSNTGQPAWAYTVTAAKQSLQPVVIDDKVYLRDEKADSEVRLTLADGLPDTGEYALPPDVARAIAKQRRAAAKPAPIARPSDKGGKMPFITVRTTVAPGGKALAAAGAKRWVFPAPAGWTIDRVAGESAVNVYALLSAPAGKKPVR
jgi:outer membrane protein assembly factor BamB